MVDWSELKSLSPNCFLECRRVFRLIGGASTTMASTTVEVTDFEDIAENLLTSGIIGDSESATTEGHAIRSANFSAEFPSAAFLARRCLAILSCKGNPLITLVAFVGDTISSSITSSMAPSVNICSLRAGLFRTVTFLMRLSSHSRSTSLVSPPIEPHSPSNTTNSSEESTFAFGVDVPSLSDSRPSPSPTSLRFSDLTGTCGTSTADGLAEGRIGRTVEASSSSDEYGFSRAVLKESVREEG